MEITKEDKKALRQIIEIGLQREYEHAILGAEKIINMWNPKSNENKEIYMELFRHIENCDKKIARRYNHMSGSNYHFIVADQLTDHIVSENELESLSEKVKDEIFFIRNL
jgi:hypothetical protein